MNDLHYWQIRCELAEKCIEESPCDPDITQKQIDSLKEWEEFKNQPVPSQNELVINAEYLMTIHPELSKGEAESLKEFALSKTIALKQCYGDGSIIYPQWKRSIK